MHKATLSSIVWFTKKSAFSISVDKNFLIVACCTFGRFQIRTLTTNRFKNQTNEKLKLLDYDCNHLQGFVKQKIVTLHHFGLKLKVRKHLNQHHYFEQTLSMQQLLLKIHTTLDQMFMCPQQLYYAAFGSQNNHCSPSQCVFKKNPPIVACFTFGSLEMQT